jgi:RNA polymerase sigma-70 factor (ECF subfamily)
MYSADEQIVSRTLAGDRDAFGILVHKYQEMVFAYAFQKVRNEADAQDVMQEVFLRAYRSLYALRHPHRFRSWLYTIMSNECNRWLARAAKTRQREVLLANAGGDELRVEPGHTIPTEGWRADLEQAMAALPDENRVAVSMFYMGDCSLKEISEFLGVSVNTVRGKLHRARQQLGRALSEQYGRLLKSHKLRGGFLMQMMEQLRHTPAPTMGFAWSSATVGKTVFSLITALCILIGLIGARDDFSTELSANQIGVSSSGTNRLPMEVALLESAPYLARSPITGVPEPTGKRPLGFQPRLHGAKPSVN